MLKMRFAGLLLASMILVPIAAHAAPPLPKPEGVSSADPRTPEDERKGFHLPEGFEIELVAAEPLIHKPLNLAFDDRGRLWVTDTLEYPFPAAEGTTPRDGVKVLEDIGPDGRARTVRTFATGLNIPIGILPLPSRRSEGDVALVHSIPDILRLSDTDGDGRADRREVLYSTFGSRDTHGMTNAFTWGFDGWIYACHGFSNTSTVAGADREPITMQSGNVYRMRPEGTHLEYFTHGQVNPFGLAFDPLGNLYSCDCHSRPVYQLLRGGWYPSFAKPDDGLGFAPDMMKHDHGSTAISGISYYAAGHFPESYRKTVFIGNVMTNRINHDRLEWHGSTPQAIVQDDFLWSEDNWFRPVDIELGPDGALYVADFYNRIIGHYEVPLTHPGRDRERGRIWRIVYRGAGGTKLAPVDPGTGPEAARDALVDRLGDPNLSVRTPAANQLAARSPDASLTTVATGDANLDRRVHALWVLNRWNILDDATLTALAGDPASAVRVHAQRVLGERPELAGPLRALALGGLSDPDHLVRRCAAEALGRHPEPSQIAPLLALRQATAPDDTHLIHVARMALRDQLRDDAAWTEVEGKTWSDRDRRDIADVAPGVPSAAAARFLLGQLRRDFESEGRTERLVHHVARYGADGSEAELTALVAGLGETTSRDRPRQASLLRTIQQGIQERGQTPGPQMRGLALEVAGALLRSRNSKQVVTGVQLVSGFGLGELKDRLVALATDGKSQESIRAATLPALSTVAPEEATGVLDAVLSDSSNPVGLRDQAVAALGSSARPEAEAILLRELPRAPARLQASIAAALAVRPRGARALLDLLESGKASPRVLQEPRVSLLLVTSNPPEIKQRIDALVKDLPPSDTRLRDLLNARRKRYESHANDPALGAKVFEKNCMACHQFRGQGARVGPQLDGVGARGVDRLLEDILDPNRNVDQAFRTTNLALKDGRIVSGLLLREEGEVLVLADSQGKEVRVPRDQVDEQSLSQLSPMPANFAEQIDEADLDQLLSYLLAPVPQ
jgi:putative heme-binding domain-containing protein